MGAENGSEIGVDHSAVADDGNRLSPVGCREGFNPALHPRSKSRITLTIGDSVPSSGSRPLHPFGICDGRTSPEFAVAPITKANFLEVIVHAHLQMMTICDRLGGVESSQEMA